jgi:hypothetical protein
LGAGVQAVLRGTRDKIAEQLCAGATKQIHPSVVPRNGFLASLAMTDVVVRRQFRQSVSLCDGDAVAA